MSPKRSGLPRLVHEKRISWTVSFVYRSFGRQLRPLPLPPGLGSEGTNLLCPLRHGRPTYFPSKKWKNVVSVFTSTLGLPGSSGRRNVSPTPSRLQGVPSELPGKERGRVRRIKDTLTRVPCFGDISLGHH